LSSVAPRRRLFPAAVLVLSVGAAIVLRLGFLQIALHGHYVERAEGNQRERVRILPARGSIRDRDGRLLAQDLRTYSLYAVPRQMKDPARMARRLARALDLDVQDLAREFKRRPAFCWVVRHRPPGLEVMVSDSTKSAKTGWSGVFLESELRRSYPAGEPLAQLVGRADVDNRGVEGVELQFDNVLRGEQGWRSVLRDGRGRQIGLPGWSNRNPVHGHSIDLTIDADIQSVVCDRLRAAVDSLDATKAIAVVVDPWTGEVLAAGSEPQPDGGPYRNQAITDQFEPGSTYKMVTMSSALEEGVVKPSDLYDACEGVCDFGGFKIHDSHPHGMLTIRDAVRYSSNIVAAKVGIKVGSRALYEYSTAFGFGALTGIEFPGETPGLLRHPAGWSGRSLPTISMGHELSVTALQLALAYGAVANGGTLMAPQILKQEFDADGRSLQEAEPRPLRRVISPETAETMRGMLQSVVDSGTATRAALAWAPVAGKTGTAQKYDVALHSYKTGKYLASFVGFVPAKAPRLVCVVMVDEPRKGYYGGDVAAPVFRKIMEDLYRLRGGPLAPAPARVRFERPRPRDVVVPGVRALPLARAREELERRGLRARVAGDGARVLAQAPAAGERAERGTVVTLSTVPAAGGVMPRVLGLTVRQALTQLSASAISAKVVGRGVVVRQEPAPGASLSKTPSCVLTCEERDQLVSMKETP
jgi:cell division protein FtsI/penicillin-binding protein 2